ncbi:uncharacterized protein SCHCODRAFT_02569893 [Schizophyllum commune H4-8]|uniref:uncharacterized protein n=1 Tax=Schizophyllum commune (strain H4-8 / FGSC 9210) TaxID=578458 RepID=UPI00215DE87B|nr:uncharacterized protein SCHCODRAFT_02569893 [Schizophyllum commune H4-8]KAI5896818.1 hypothetical protein SCHCODRAFT_02569893 [Schizophyllum commune H4-8]
MEASGEGPAQNHIQTRDVIEAQAHGAEKAGFVGHPASSMQHLPTELWSNIYYFALPDSWNSALLGRRRIRYAQVCRTWRAIAFSTPRLWNKIRLHCRIDFTLAMAEVDRTGNTPLDVDVLTVFADSPGYEDVWAVWTCLCSLSHRWASADITLGMMQAAWDILSGRDFPLLRSIYLSPSSKDVDEFDDPLRHFVHAPNVSELDVRLTFVTALALALPLPWALECLHFHSYDYTIRPNHISPDVAWGITVACKDTLQSASFEFARTLSPPLLSAPAACFPALQDLDLSDEGSCFILLIEAPNLVELSMKGGDGEDGGRNSELQMLSRLSTLLDRSGDCSQLQYLTLISVDLERGDLISCLRRVPSLVNLEIVSFFYEESNLAVVRALIRDPAEPSSMALLPCLTALTICHNDWRKEYPVRQLFCAAVRSRMLPTTYEGRELACLEACHTHYEHSCSCRDTDGEDDDYDMTLERIKNEFDLKNYDTEKGLETRFYWVGESV